VTSPRARLPFALHPPAHPPLDRRLFSRLPFSRRQLDRRPFSRRPLLTLSAFALCLALGLPDAASAQPVVQTGDLPLTVAEASDFTRTATYDDVVAWLGTLQSLGAEFTVMWQGETTEGRPMPLVIVSRPLITDPAEAHASGKPILFLQANIHAGEVEGKDAMLMFLRDVTLGAERALLDDVILLIDPIHNPDGNEKWAPVARNRRGQDGPEEVGIRYNGMGLDLNRDYVKAGAPETRNTMNAVLNVWHPHLFVDMHTTNGSRHGYDLTYAAPMTPTAPPQPVAWTNEVLLPEIRRRTAERGHPMFDYGNHDRGNPPTSWRTFGWQPRYASNYMGIRGMISILSEAVSYRPFRTRLSATYWLVREITDYMGQHAAEVLALLRESERQVVAWGTDPASAPELGVDFELRSRGREMVTYEVMTPPEDPSDRRARGTYTGEIREAEMEVMTVFEPVGTRPFPAGYVIPVAFPEAIELLRLHGIRVEQFLAPWEGEVGVFRIETLTVQERPYQGHRMVLLEGEYRTETRGVNAGDYWVSTAQPLGALVFTLLEPEIDDSLFTWNLFDRSLSEGRDSPVLKLMQVPAAARTGLPGPGESR